MSEADIKTGKKIVIKLMHDYRDVVAVSTNVPQVSLSHA
jgi:hypothetical protein